MDGRVLIAIASDRQDKNTLINSPVFVFDEAEGRFKPFQDLPSDGAHGARFFEAFSHTWLALANFGDRFGQRYNSSSSIWRLQPSGFVKAGEVSTWGATDWEHFELNGENYIVVSQEGIIKDRMYQQGPIFKLQVGCKSVSPQALPAMPRLARAERHLTVEVDARGAVVRERSDANSPASWYAGWDRAPGDLREPWDSAM